MQPQNLFTSSCASSTPLIARATLQVHFSSKVVQVTVPTEAGEFVQVTTQQEPHGGSLAHHEAAAASPSTYRCRLLVGADGLHSRIRATLESAQPAGDWALRGKPGWSTGMRFKVRLCAGRA